MEEAVREIVINEGAMCKLLWKFRWIGRVGQNEGENPRVSMKRILGSESYWEIAITPFTSAKTNERTRRTKKRQSLLLILITLR